MEWIPPNANEGRGSPRKRWPDEPKIRFMSLVAVKMFLKIFTAIKEEHFIKTDNWK